MYIQQTYLTFLVALIGTTGCRKSSLDMETIRHDGEDREYFLHVPDTEPDESGMPLLFNFHGFAGTAESQLEWSDFRSLANEHGFLLVYPQGTEMNGVSHWNSALPGPSNKSTADDFGFIEAIITRLSNQHSVDAGRIYATGYSNGGFMSYSLACYKSDVFAAIAPVSSTMLNEFDGDCAPTRPVPVISANGTRDDTVPYNGGQEGYQAIDDVVDYWVNHNNITTQPEVTDVSSRIRHRLYTGGDNGVAVSQYRVERGEHVWFSEGFGGGSLAAVVWDFMSAYDLDGVRQ
jgi:polyhydroxybutyrate depolymerase